MSKVYCPKSEIQCPKKGLWTLEFFDGFGCSIMLKISAILNYAVHSSTWYSLLCSMYSLSTDLVTIATASPCLVSRAPENGGRPKSFKFDHFELWKQGDPGRLFLVFLKKLLPDFGKLSRLLTTASWLIDDDIEIFLI